MFLHYQNYPFFFLPGLPISAHPRQPEFADRVAFCCLIPLGSEAIKINTPIIAARVHKQARTHCSEALKPESYVLMSGPVYYLLSICDSQLEIVSIRISIPCCCSRCATTALLVFVFRRRCFVFQRRHFRQRESKRGSDAWCGREKGCEPPLSTSHPKLPQSNLKTAPTAAPMDAAWKILCKAEKKVPTSAVTRQNAAGMDPPNCAAIFLHAVHQRHISLSILNLLRPVSRET